MQHQQQHSPSNWEAACLSLMDKELPALNITEPPSSQVLHDDTVHVARDAPQPATKEPSAPEQEIEPEPTDLNSIFARYRSLGAEINRLVAQQRLFEQALFGSSFTSEVRLENIEAIAKSAIERLIDRAERTFAPPGGQLSISRNEVMEALGLDDWAYSRRHRYDREDDQRTVEQIVDLVKMQEFLESTFGGDAGIRRGLSQAAAVIIREFNLKREDAVVRTKSGVVLTTRIYSTKKDYGSNKGMYEPYHSGRDRVPLFQALETFFKHADLHQLYHYGWARSDLVHYGFSFTPRDKRTAPGLEISFFKEEWKFKFGSLEAEKLMLFLGEFGQEE